MLVMDEEEPPAQPDSRRAPASWLRRFPALAPEYMGVGPIDAVGKGPRVERG